MKNIKFKLSYTVLIIVSILMGHNINSQEFIQDNYKTFFNFKTLKQNDDTRLLEVSFLVQNLEDKNDEHPVYKAKIDFINKLDEKEVILGSILTSTKGEAKLILPKNQNFLKDKEGNITLIARFKGTDKLEPIEEELIIKDLFLDLNLTEIDSVKTVTLRAYTTNNSGEEIPIEEVDIAFYVGGMFSKMKIHDGTIEEGFYEFEYSHFLPGDENGMLSIYSIIEDHDEFANVTKMKIIKWGHIQDHPKEPKNSLWAKNAPLWMYIVLAVLLIAVWANYVHVVSSLIKLKIKNKRGGITSPIKGN
jgi:hypothetical protein